MPNVGLVACSRQIREANMPGCHDKIVFWDEELKVMSES